MSLIPFLLVGLLGSVHCVGMCGGIVSAFSVTSRRRVIPIAPMAAAQMAMPQSAEFTDAMRVTAYNAGRLTSYATAGAIAGGLAQGLSALSFMSSLQAILYLLANLMLVALGLYLMDAWQGLTRLEAAGRGVWSRVQPLTKRLLPADSFGKAFALGSLWGWVPCGMVYSVLMSAMLAGSALQGAAVMFAFGTGTLPALMAMGLFGVQLQRVLHHRHVRLASGIVVLLFGILGLYRAVHGMTPAWLEIICVTPASPSFHWGH
ncbi:sulfite exporter TauE/SafE family protein [Herbaspirillum sp. GCM10030257]|uniref:sulfite exporter TauE/SafE family protein n=1 Tax=Herbaspirillum sp. GCM10030257 TaxID=3273393 RepID=UPI00360E775A